MRFLQILSANMRRKLIFGYVMGLIYSAFWVVGAELARDWRWRLPDSLGGLFLRVFLVALPIGGLVYLLLTALEFMKGHATDSKDSGGHSILVRRPTDIRLMIILFAIIFLAWFVCFLAFYPGIFAYDAPDHISDVYNWTMSTHHPIFHTLMVAGLFGFGGTVLNSWTAGLAIYTLINMTALAGAAAYSLVFMRRLRIPVWLWAIGALFLAASPVIALLAVSVTKDIIFSALCVFLFLFMLEAVLEPEAFFRSKWLQARFVATIVMMTLFRNNGIYALILCVPFLIIAMRGKAWRMAWLCVGGVVLYMLTATALQVATRAERGSIAEALSVPIQQLSRVYNVKNDELDQDTRESLNRLMHTIWNYHPMIADPPKFSWDDDVFRAERRYFIRLWAQLGRRYPREYANAFLMNTYMLWYVNFDYRVALTWIETEAKHGGREELFPAPVLPGLQRFYQNFHDREFLSRHRFVTVLHSPALVTWLFIFVLGVNWYLKKYEFLYPTMFLVGLWLTVVLAPIILPRYVLMFYVLMPFLVGMCVVPGHKIGGNGNKPIDLNTMS